jgi:hypothetical protein
MIARHCHPRHPHASSRPLDRPRSAPRSAAGRPVRWISAARPRSSPQCATEPHARRPAGAIPVGRGILTWERLFDAHGLPGLRLPDNGKNRRSRGPADRQNCPPLTTPSDRPLSLPTLALGRPAEGPARKVVLGEEFRETLLQTLRNLGTIASRSWWRHLRSHRAFFSSS